MTDSLGIQGPEMESRMRVVCCGYRPSDGRCRFGMQHLSGLSQCQRVMCRAHWVWQSIVLGCLPQRGVWELLFLGFRLKDRVGWIWEVSFFFNAYVAFVKIP